MLQSQLTPNGLGIQKDLEKKFIDKGNNYLFNLPNDIHKLNKTNVVMRDFVSMKKETIDLILALNIAKGSVRNDRLDSYVKAIEYKAYK